MGVLKEDPEESTEVSLRRQLLDKSKENDKLRDQIQALQVQFTQRSHINTMTMSPKRRRPSGNPPKCRFPNCTYPGFFDGRVDEYREWCHDHHMTSALRLRVELPCRQCHVWPRRKGYDFCSGDDCHHPLYSNAILYKQVDRCPETYKGTAL